MADNASLKQIILQAEQPVFVVLDGAQFEDLPKSLFDGDFVHKPLYLDRGNGTADQLRTAPQLAWLDRDWHDVDKDNTGQPRPTSELMLDRLFDLVGERHAAVFWFCDAGGDVLFRHLRTINMIMLPTAVAMDRGKGYEGDPLAQPSDDAQNADHEVVLFRHADSNVMAQVLPSLTYAHLARVLGPAQQILYSADPDWSEKPMRVSRADDMPTPPAGPLKLTVQEVGEIEAKRSLAARHRRISYLREACPAETQGASNEALEEHLRISEETGKQLGLVSEGAHCRWAYLMVATRGQIAASPAVTDYIRNGGTHPDDQVGLVMKSTIAALRQQRQLEACL
ncbi:DUF4123 domain-containing protein [Allorhizobium taibaishanense]|uniref:DUF4123 domain-containing protein n=1 Tax=Allorhizobium taibaishanense TaxID=887144 RepID=A0A1Q9AB60_9HYPH|nr:hypothetical protein [Allorhizobium taibaishanense]MBB4010106.1 hypothetical protein [Allorhizobium taibaishanense]OLP52119.1 hypothetical protein BJF91_02435 [Allorhizobium taibaishanense]